VEWHFPVPRAIYNSLDGSRVSGAAARFSGAAADRYLGDEKIRSYYHYDAQEDIDAMKREEEAVSATVVSTIRVRAKHGGALQREMREQVQRGEPVKVEALWFIYKMWSIFVFDH